MSDGPPKTLSSRFQTLSMLQPAEPPRGPKERTGSGCRRPRPPRRQKDRFSPRNQAEQAVQNRSIGTLAGRAQARYPLQACNARKPASGVYSDISSGLEPATTMQIALFQPDIPQNTGTILRLCAAWAWPPISSNRPAFRSPTGLPPGRNGLPGSGSLIGTTPGRNSRNGGAARGHGWSVHHQGRRPIAIFVTGRRTSFCSGGRTSGVPAEVETAASAAVDPDRYGAAVAQCRHDRGVGRRRSAKAAPERSGSPAARPPASTTASVTPALSRPNSRMSASGGRSPTRRSSAPSADSSAAMPEGRGPALDLAPGRGRQDDDGLAPGRLDGVARVRPAVLHHRGEGRRQVRVGGRPRASGPALASAAARDAETRAST